MSNDIEALKAKLLELEAENIRLTAQLGQVFQHERRLMVVQESLEAQKVASAKLAEAAKTFNLVSIDDEIFPIVTQIVSYDFNFERCLIFLTDSHGLLTLRASEGYFDEKSLKAIQEFVLDPKSASFKELFSRATQPLIYNSKSGNIPLLADLSEKWFLEEMAMVDIGYEDGLLRGLLVVGNGSAKVEIYNRVRPDSEYNLMLLNLGSSIAAGVNNVRAKEAIRHEAAQAKIAKEKLQNVIDSVPGFVAVGDGKGQWLESSASFKRFREIKELVQASQNFQRSGLPLQTLQVEWHMATNSVSEINSENSNLEEKIEAYAVSFERIKYPENGFIIAGVPVSDLRETQKQLELQRSKAEYSARLATLGEMAGGIAHEINNPLTMILGHSTQLLRELEQSELDVEKLRYKTGKITSIVSRIAKIVQGLRTFSRKGETDPMAPTSLRSLVEDSLELCAARFHNDQISLEVDEVPDVEFPSRSVQISQVVMNLLSNAFDAVKGTDKKTVKVSCVVLPNQIQILIIDSGPGIPEKIAKKIFDPFFTTKDVGQGTGLGLSVSKSIMQEHGGDLVLLKRSNPTTFQIIIQRSKTESHPTAKSA